MIGNFVGKNPSAELKTKADKVVNATNGDFAGLDSSGNLIDSGYSANDLIVPIHEEEERNNKKQNRKKRR